MPQLVLDKQDKQDKQTTAPAPGEMKDGHIRVAEIHTPSEEWEDPRTGQKKLFEGYRRGVRFALGRASLPEPVKVDFPSEESWAAEHANWESLVDYMRREYGYSVKYRWVSSSAEDDEI